MRVVSNSSYLLNVSLYFPYFRNAEIEHEPGKREPEISKRRPSKPFVCMFSNSIIKLQFI